MVASSSAKRERNCGGFEVSFSGRPFHPARSQAQAQRRQHDWRLKASDYSYVALSSSAQQNRGLWAQHPVQLKGCLIAATLA